IELAAQPLPSSAIAITPTKSSSTQTITPLGGSALSFDSKSGVNGKNQIVFGSNDNLSNGQLVTYSKGGSGNTAVGGLTDGQNYAVLFIDPKALAAPPLPSSAIAITPTAASTTQTITPSGGSAQSFDSFAKVDASDHTITLSNHGLVTGQL